MADSDDDDEYGNDDDDGAMSNDSDNEMMEDIDDSLLNETPASRRKTSQIKKPSNAAHIRENPEEIVDLADMRMIGNVISKLFSWHFEAQIIASKCKY